MTDQPDQSVVVARLWAAVDRLTKPSQHRIVRDDEPSEWLLAQPVRSAAVVSSYGIVPSLWEQAAGALVGGEVGGGTGTKPLRERSPADLDLMEIMSIIRETVRTELAERDTDPLPATVPGQIRRLASVVIRADPDHGWWWEYRFAQWARVLETYLHNAEHTPKMTRLRNSACPSCAARQMTIEGEDGPVVVPVLVVDFTADGLVRACECMACGRAWFRGVQMEMLAAELGCEAADTPASEVVAQTA